MTGYCFAKILKYKEIDDIFLRRKADKSNQKQRRNGKNQNNEQQPEEEKTEKLPDPKDIEHTPVNFGHKFTMSCLNKVMLNQYDNCACFHMNPDKTDFAATQIEQKQEDVVWIRFQDDYEVDDLSAETIASMFSEFGDFYIVKNTRKSVLLQFYYFDKDAISEKSVAAFIQLIESNKDKYKVAEVKAFNEAPKFVAHNHVE